MSISYNISVNETFHFDFENNSISPLDAVTVETNNFHVLHQNLPYIVEIISSDFTKKKYTVKVNNNSYNVAISNPLDTLIKEMGFTIGKTKQVHFIKAPMPGLILEISVIIGQAVKENDSLLILTAMKMENSFLSPREGIIKSIAISVGDSVVKGDLLIEFEE